MAKLGQKLLEQSNPYFPHQSFSHYLYFIHLHILNGAVNRGQWPRKGSWAARRTGLWDWRPADWKTWNYYE
jgi:hypothetical protein